MRAPPIERICEHCGLAFSAVAYQVSIGRARFCSRPCKDAALRLPIEQRFWSKVNKDGPVIRPELGPCWPWTGGFTSSGYGQFRDAEGRQVGAHRMAYELTHGQLRPDMQARHRCDYRPCCRPDHLEEGTQTANEQDKAARGRQADGQRNGANQHPERRPRGERHGQARLTLAQVLDLRIRYRPPLRGLLTQFAKEAGVARSTIKRAISGETWGVHHPDVGGDAEMFKRVRAAYEAGIAAVEGR